MPQNSETLKGSFTKFFGTVRQKSFDGNLWYPLLYINYFDSPIFLRHWREAHVIFRHCETKKILRKILILAPPPPPLIKTFSIPEIIATVKDSPTEIFGTVSQKIFNWNSWCSPSLIQTFSIPETIATKKDSPRENFGTVRQKIFNGKSWYSPPLLFKLSRYPKFLQQ